MRFIGYISIIVLSLGVAAYAIGVYALLPLGAVVHPDMRPTFETHGLGLYLHIFGAFFALVLGPFQFSTKLRSNRPGIHRLLGKLYLGIGIVIGGLAGLHTSFNAYGGLVARVGFACLSVAWIYTGFEAYRAIRVRDIRSHRRWMIRNFALTFAAVTLRLWIPLSLAGGVPFELAYQGIAWLCWVPNLLVAELFLIPSDQVLPEGQS